MSLTVDELDIIRTALGLLHYSKPMYNRYWTLGGGEAFYDLCRHDLCVDMVRRGLMSAGEVRPAFGGSRSLHMFHVTPAGAAAVGHTLDPDLPNGDSPPDDTNGWLWRNPQNRGLEWSQKHPELSGECEDAEIVKEGTYGEYRRRAREDWA